MEKIVNNLELEPQIDFTEIQKDSYIDPNVNLSRPPVAISIGEHNFGQDVYQTPFGSYGDFSCIVGASKSRKTFLKSALISGYIGGQSVSYFSDIKGHDNEGKYIIDIDTEQSKYHTQRVSKRVSRMVGSTYPNHLTFSLREYSFKVKLDFINWLIYESEYANQIGIISIDGIADLVDDVNDLKQSNMVVESLLKWTTDANCHIITVLHRNFGSQKPTGHLGSAVLKKAETVAFVEKEDEFTKVKCEYSRNIPFDEFSFKVNDFGLPKQVSINSSDVWSM